MGNFVKITVPGSPEFLKICENTAIEIATIFGLDIDSAEEVGMAVFEACKNVTCHGSDSWCAKYEMEVETTEECFRITIRSEGEHIIEKCKIICLDCPSEGDLGMAIIESVMDEVTIQSDGKCNNKITMVKNLC